MTGHEKFIVDEKGQRVSVVLDIKDYEKILDELDELDAIRAFEVAKAENDEAIPLEQAFEEIDRERKRQGG